jgi:hypothetical protein
MNTKQEILKAIEDYNTGNFVQKWLALSKLKKLVDQRF